ncbi:MAG: hypothetical protein J6N45_00080 [Alphaproteobacteria bacterium]|nr:hypothetical protein [Alphaproteobacteria bacterium]
MNNSNFILRPEELSAAEIGLFDLGNGKFAKEINRQTKVRSVIAIVDEEQHVAYGLCPTYQMMCWCPTCLGVTTQHIISGMEATRLILDEAKEKGISLPAAEFCANYEGYGVKKGEAFLLSKTEMRRITISSERIFAAWRQVSKQSTDWLALFTSTVNNDYCIWSESFSTMMVSGWRYQCRTLGVVPMVKIKF